MNAFVFPLLMGGQAGGGESAGGLGGMMTFLPFVLIIGIFYFLIIRPQNRKQKETQKMLAAVKKGDRVVTIGGIHGTIQSVKESSNTVIVRVDDNVKLEFNRSAISSVQPVYREEKEEKEEKAEEAAGESAESK